ncbi:MAG: STAS domain-containing protein [Spirochaetes bacterium]|nr:STAS domain-containing protein [Spirochaetota bacterium]
MTLDSKKTGNCIIVKLPRQIDMVLSAAIERELQSVFQQEPLCDFIMDLSNVVILSSSGLRIFITAKRKLRSANREIVLCGVKDNGIIETFRVSQLLDIFKVFPSEDEALAYLESRPGF